MRHDPSASFDCTPQQYHAGLDILWDSIGNQLGDHHTVYHAVADRIAELEVGIKNRDRSITALCKQVDKQDDRIAELEAENERLRTALPTTSDGVTIVPGMDVWYVCRAMRDNPICRSRVQYVSKDLWTEHGGGQPYYIRSGEPCFSTEQLAKEYKAKQLRDLADKAYAECVGLRRVFRPKGRK